MPQHIAVIGSGIAGFTLAEEIRKRQPQNVVTLLTRETGGYYSRPLLSHGFSRDDIEAKIVMKSFAAIVQQGIVLEAGAEVSEIDRQGKTLLYRQEGEEKTLVYGKLVIATGSSALIPTPFRETEDLCHVLNSLQDLKDLRRHRKKIQGLGIRPRWAVIGGGLVGCELAADLAKAGDETLLFHALPRLMERQLVEEDSATVLSVLRNELGVEVRLEQTVLGFGGEGLDLQVKLANDSVGGFHGIIVACGFKPRTELAAACGLATRRGICVDAFMTTSDTDIHAIGDCAELPDGRIYAYVTPARSQALWLAKYLSGETSEAWTVPFFKPKAKIPGFEARHDYLF